MLTLTGVLTWHCTFKVIPCFMTEYTRDWKLILISKPVSLLHVLRLNVLIIFTLHSAYSTHPPDLIALIIFDKSTFLRSSLCSFLDFLLIPLLFNPHILPRTLFLNTLNLYTSLRVLHRTSNVYKTISGYYSVPVCTSHIMWYFESFQSTLIWF